MQSFIKLMAVSEVAVCLFPINIMKKKVEVRTSEKARWTWVI